MRGLVNTASFAVAVLAAASSTDGVHAIDWRDSKCIGPVSDQGSIASSEVFGSVESVACVAAKQTGNLTALSVQQVIDCADLGPGKPSQSPTKNSLRGKQDNFQLVSPNGFFGTAFDYAKEKGLETAAAYPATTPLHHQACKYDATKVAVKVLELGGSKTTASDEKALGKALESSPVVAAFAVGERFQSYRSGILKDCGGTKRNHVMEIVASHDADGDDGTAFWVVKNSWGEGWGMKGYAQIAKDIGACGLQNATFLYPSKVEVGVGADRPADENSNSSVRTNLAKSPADDSIQV